jgi:hypothetical protein
MAILKRTGTILVMGAAAAAMIGLSSAPAFSATTFTVKPGGAITAKAGKTTLKDKNTGSTLSCASSSGKGSLKKGSGLSGNGIGSITALGFTNCTGPLGLTFTVKSSGFPWKLNATSSSGGVTKGTITGIKATLTGPSCTATVAGATASSTGTVDVSYSNSTGKLTTSGGNLHVFNVNGCAGLINSGDATAFTGSYAISPKQTITSP